MIKKCNEFLTWVYNFDKKMSRPLTKNQQILRKYINDGDFNPKEFLMKRMILVKKYSY